MKIRRVLHVIDQLRIGGAQKLLVTFAREAQERGIHMEVICLRSEEPNWIINELESFGAEIRYLPAGKLFHPGRFGELLRAIREKEPSIVQTHLTYANILGCTACSLLGVPAAATMHLAGPDRRYSRVRELLETVCIRLFARLAVAVGPKTAGLQAERLGEENVRVLLNSVEDRPASSGARERIRAELGIPDTAPVIITVGRFSIVKAFQVLIEAFAQCRNQNPEAALLLVGDGVMRKEWEKLADSLGISHAVHFTGLRDDVPDLLAASDLYVCSSTVEGTPLAVMEAVMAGLPVVSTDVGDLPEILHPGFSMLVEPEDSQALAADMRKILDDANLRAEMGRSAREYALAHFSSSVWMDTLLNIYQEAAES